MTSASGLAARTPLAIAVAASAAERLPLNELGATTIFIAAYSMPMWSLRPDSFRPSPSVLLPNASQRGRGEGLVRGGENCPRRALINGNCPVLVLCGLAADRTEVDALQLLRELADLARADGSAVDLDDRRYL